jgi:hypothetical protein
MSLTISFGRRRGTKGIESIMILSEISGPKNSEQIILKPFNRTEQSGMDDEDRREESLVCAVLTSGQIGQSETVALQNKEAFVKWECKLIRAH